MIRNVNFKIYDITNWEKINYDTHIANISRSKHNQKIKYDELVEYNFKFFENSYPKYDCGTLPKPLFKKIKIEHVSGSTVQSFVQFIFIVSLS